jgi:putative Ca2+/H+ antiporter (TMEM165/GDT1 family)
MTAFILSAFIIAISETGDKTQFIALCLASRFKRPVPILLGILAATFLSNLAAGALGQYIGIWLQGRVLHGLLAASFFGAAIWAVIPDKAEDCLKEPAKGHSIFLASLTSFLIAEMGDKTQLATVVLAAHFHSVAAVVLGTTLGMMAVNIPAVMLGYKVLARMPVNLIRIAAGLVFAAMAVYELSTFW